jgi:hypothetical protein
MNNHLNHISEEREWQIFELLEGNLNGQEAHSLLEEIKQNSAEWKFYQEMKLTYLNVDWSAETKGFSESDSGKSPLNLSNNTKKNEFTFPKKQILHNISQNKSISAVHIGFINKRNLQQWSIAASIVLILGIAFVFKSKNTLIQNNPNLNSVAINNKESNPTVSNSSKLNQVSNMQDSQNTKSVNSKLKNSIHESYGAIVGHPVNPKYSPTKKQVEFNSGSNLKFNYLNKAEFTSPEKTKETTSIIRPIQIASSSTNSAKSYSNNSNRTAKLETLNPLDQNSEWSKQNPSNSKSIEISNLTLQESDDRDVKIVYANLDTEDAYKKEIKSIKRQWLKEAAQELRYGRLPEVRLSTRKQKDTWVPEVGINIASKSVIMHTTLVQR